MRKYKKMENGGDTTKSKQPVKPKKPIKMGTEMGYGPKPSQMDKMVEEAEAYRKSQIKPMIPSKPLTKKSPEKMAMGGKTPMTAKQKKFAALAPPKNKITFADRIAGAKKKKK